jgi:hypothetical protein
MANQMLAVGSTIWDWGIPLGIVKTNPFVDVFFAAASLAGFLPAIVISISF